MATPSVALRYRTGEFKPVLNLEFETYLELGA
jgi:hypothetical protein